MNALTRSGRFLRVNRMVRKELRQLFRDPKTKRIIFVSPIFQLLAFGYAVNTDVRHVATVLSDYDRTAESRELAQTLTATGYFDIVEHTLDEGVLTAHLDRGEAVVAVVIPAGFGRDLAAGRTASVQVLVDGSNSNTGVVAQGYAGRIIQTYGMRAVGRAGQGLDLRTRAWFNPDLVSRVYNVPAVIGVIVLLMSLLLTSLAVVREREMGTLDQLLVSPLTPVELMLGKTIPVAGVAMVQLVIVTVVALFWFHIPFRGSPPLLLAAAVVYILAGLSFGIVISTISRTQQEAFLTMFLVLFPAIILSGFMYPVETMPPFFQWVTLLNPLRHFLEIVRGIFLKGAGFLDLWTQFLALSLMAGGAMAYGTRRFRKMIG